MHSIRSKDAMFSKKSTSGRIRVCFTQPTYLSNPILQTALGARLFKCASAASAIDLTCLAGEYRSCVSFGHITQP